MLRPLARKLITIVTLTTFIFVNLSIHVQADSISQKDTEKVVAAFNSAATKGFVDYEQYKKFSEVFQKYSGRDFESNPLTESEIQELELLIGELRNSIPKWIEKLIQSAKSIEADGLVTFNNPDWSALSNECLNVGSPLNSKVPLDEFVEVLNKMKSGQDFDWKVFENDLGRDYGDCVRHIEGFVRQVSKAKDKLETELNVLAEKIQKKEDECRKQAGEAQKTCNDELDELYQEFDDKEEKVTRLEEFEDESMKLKALLGFAAIIAGVVIGVYCCPQIGASIAAWGGQMLEDNQHYKKSKPVTETKKTGRKRTLDKEGDATDEEKQTLIDELKSKGFNQVPVDDKTPGKIAYQVFQSNEELRIYLVKSKKLIAQVEAINVDVKDNTRDVVRLGSIEVIQINGDVFVDDNRIKLNVIGKGPDGRPINVSIVETAIGSNRFTLIVE